ncbi:MAG: EAL domain-containing protein [Candidatus Xenobium sp.]|nr:EAL domain-containing protein [Burkholderiales bacterium]
MNSDPGRILVVDDQGVDRLLMEHYLEDNGFNPTSVASCEEALEKIANEEFDLVLLDIIMPGMGGLELLRILREKYTLTELPVIMATSKSESSDVIEALELGANDYITKPVDIPVAIARLRTHMHLRRMDRQLRESEERYALAVRGANEGLWDWDLRKGQVYYSPRFKHILGAEEDAVGASPREWFDRIHIEDRERVMGEIQEHLRGLLPHLESQHRLVHEEGTYRWVLARGLAVRDESGQAYRMAGSLADITTSQVYDNATGLPGRQLLHDVLERSLARVNRKVNSQFAVLVVSIDQFELLVASLGVSEGNRLLAHVGRRLQLASRASDTVARLEGSRFGVLLDDIRHISDVIRVANRIAMTLRDPIRVADQHCRITASIGIAVSKTGYDRPEHLLRDANTALVQARSQGGDRHEMFDRKMQCQAEERLQLESDLRQAVDRLEFTAFYQSIVSAADESLEGFEALIRWNHPHRGMLHPAQFLPICEQTGLIVPVGACVLRIAAEQAHRWHEMHPALSQITLNVNLSARQIAEPDLVDSVARILKETHLDPSLLRIDITEDLLVQKLESTLDTLKALRDLGLRLGLDGFATGYSSLSHLHRLPIEYLQIDRSFVQRLETDEEAWDIVSLVVTMARHLKLRTIATGVETREQANLLRNLEVDSMQGYLFSRPVDTDQATALLEENLIALRSS